MNKRNIANLMNFDLSDFDAYSQREVEEFGIKTDMTLSTITQIMNKELKYVMKSKNVSEDEARKIIKESFDFDLLENAIKRWQYQKAVKNPNIKQSILEYKSATELIEDMKNYPTKEEQKLEERSKNIEANLLEELVIGNDKYEIVKIDKPEQFIFFAENGTNWCWQNAGTAQDYCKKYKYAYIILKNGITQWGITNPNIKPLNITTRNDTNIANENQYAYNSLGIAIALLKDIEVLRITLKKYENIKLDDVVDYDRLIIIKNQEQAELVLRKTYDWYINGEEFSKEKLLKLVK